MIQFPINNEKFVEFENRARLKRSSGQLSLEERNDMTENKQSQSYHLLKKMKLTNDTYEEFATNEIMDAFQKAKRFERQIKYNDKIRSFTPAATPVEPQSWRQDAEMFQKQANENDDNTLVYSEAEDYIVQGYISNGIINTEGQLCLENIEPVQYSLYDLTEEEQQMIEHNNIRAQCCQTQFSNFNGQQGDPDCMELEN